MRRWILVPLVLLVAGTGAVPAAAAQSLEDSFGSNKSSRTDVKGAIEDSIRFLMIEHAIRIGFQEKTRDALKGPFFPDYHRSVAFPDQWGDSDRWFTNYIGHPSQGAVTGFIWLNSSRDSEISPALTNAYVKSRLLATAWAAGYSVQFEIGPLSEASIGNVGMNRATAGWVDHVMTPLGGLGIMVAEDLLDRFVIQKMEARTNSKLVRVLLRVALNPTRASANVTGLRPAWYRDRGAIGP
jgi:hypothetical protein